MPAKDAEFRAELMAILPRLRRFSRSLARHEADADDLLQTALERALKRSDQFQAGTRLDSWMYRMIKNIWIDEIRARNRRAQTFAPEEAGLGVGAEDPAFDRQVRAMSVERAMETLSDDQRIAVSLVLVEGLSYKEAASVLDLPMGTLTSRLARGRQALADQLAGKAGEST
ncbi:sigma-70 family RNA polymerase sigma factor [Hyphobacterium indicum]|uniref:sigma-70 family RNA polymerase sigma factor n=1 Tax=Hyphobacterium indicum TaxID=2162714 RepID=UPI001F2A3995|nr:sigma-70 family RNA polymerase sigma factor [Hyphobacterium indicum]